MSGSNSEIETRLARIENARTHLNSIVGHLKQREGEIHGINQSVKDVGEYFRSLHELAAEARYARLDQAYTKHKADHTDDVAERLKQAVALLSPASAAKPSSVHPSQLNKLNIQLDGKTPA